MNSSWDKTALVRAGLDATHTATSIGFTAAKLGTKLGFSATRGVASTVAHLTGSAVDYAIFGGQTSIGPLLSNTVASAVTFTESLALLPLRLGEGLTTASIVAAHSAINTLAQLFPGSDDASFSLASFVTLVRKERTDPVMKEHLPEAEYSVTETTRALVAWGALQSVTTAWKEKEWLKHMREINILEVPSTLEVSRRRESRIRVESNIIYPGQEGQVIVADIDDEGPATPITPSTPLPVTVAPFHEKVAKRERIRQRPLSRMTDDEIKSTFRRLSKLVLAGYGGASLIFFGVSPVPKKADEQANLATAINASEAEAAAELDVRAAELENEKKYDWWDVLFGKHDSDIFHSYANMDTAEREEQRKRASSAVVGTHANMPRFWVLSDHNRKEVVLVLRGTMSLNELAVDLTCEPMEFNPAQTPSPMEEGSPGMPGYVQFPSSTARSTSSVAESPTYHVHGGMLRMSKVMGGVDKPLHRGVRDALRKHPRYDLVITGHSLGAGVATLLALTWADPRTARTVPSSGLPPGRRVSAYCFAPPCVTDIALTNLSKTMITSFVYSHDVVSRLSLGSIRDMTRAAAWLCAANREEGGDEGHAKVTSRALKYRAGLGQADDAEWFLAMRKTLEANMHMADLFPPGRVWWALRDQTLHPSNRIPDQPKGLNKLRLFEVLRVEQVFDQMEFAADMLISHMPHRYDQVLHELL